MGFSLRFLPEKATNPNIPANKAPKAAIAASYGTSVIFGTLLSIKGLI